MQEFMVAIDIDLFQDWITDGLVYLQLEKDPVNFVTGSTEGVFIVSLPGKYRRLAQASLPLPTLFDEIEWLSWFSEEETREHWIRFKNLGEGWLPIRFHAEVLAGPIVRAKKYSAIIVNEKELDAVKPGPMVPQPESGLPVPVADPKDLKPRSSLRSSGAFNTG